MITTESKKSRLNLKWVAAAVLALVFVASAFAQDGPVVEEPLPDEELQMPGTIEGTGTYFEVTDSEYLNIALQSSEPVHLTLESVPQMVVMEIEAAEGASSTWITLTGFAPSTTYYKYEDDYHNGVAFTTDGNGSYTYAQDLGIGHLVFIQPHTGTIFLSYSGWSKPVGTWDSATKTATLTMDVYETIQINSNGITLNGNGHTVAGSGTGYGVYLSWRTDVTIKNLNVQGFNSGIHLYKSSGNTLTGNTCNSNNVIGIYVRDSSNNTLTGNTCNSNNRDGIHLYYSSYNALKDNTTSNNYYGIYLYSSSDNSLTGNTASNNSYGILLSWYSSNNTLTDNTLALNNWYGIYLYYNSNDNEIYKNNFIDNPTQAYVYMSIANAFNLPEPTGGNYWSNWTSPDDDNDGFVDVPYEFTGGVDNLPWVVQDGWVTNQPPVANAGPDQTVECACQQGGTTVALNGSGSDDPDDDPLTYTWTGPFAESPASGPTPTVTLLDGCVGDYEITLVVNDGELDSEPDTVQITVEDTTPPTIVCPEPITVVAQSPSGVPDTDPEILTFLAGASASDNCDPSPVITDDAPDQFPLGETTVTFTATDAWNNTSSCQATVTVQTPAEATQDLILCVQEIELPHGIENSLVSKLEAAIKSLDKGRENAAKNQLNAFINQVEDQRGNKISEEDADDLIAAAQQIIAALNGP